MSTLVSCSSVCLSFCLSLTLTEICCFIVGKVGHTPPPLFYDSPFLEIQDVPIFHRPIAKTKEPNNSCNQFVYNFYHKNNLILEECLLKWLNANLMSCLQMFPGQFYEKRLSVRETNMKLLLKTVNYIAIRKESPV